MDAIEELQQLVYVANEHTKDSQLELLWRITDVFLQAPGAHSETQKSCFGEIMEQLAYGLEQQIREELSRKLASEADAPHGLIRRLADDDIMVARPVLQGSPVLTEDDLVEISAQKGQQHCLAMTLRRDIGGRLSDALATHGDDEVLESLALNKSATLTPETFSRIADQARSSERLQNALVSRSDVPKEVMVSLLNEVSGKMKTRLEDEPDGRMASALDAAVSAVRAQVEECPNSRAERYVDDLARHGALNEQAVARFVYEDRPMEFLIALARLCEMDVVSMEHVLADATGRTLIICCRSIGFSLETFKTIALSPMSAVSSDITELMPLIRIYRHFTEEKTRRAMRFLRMRGFSAEKENAPARVGLTG